MALLKIFRYKTLSTSPYHTKHMKLFRISEVEIHQQNISQELLINMTKSTQLNQVQKPAIPDNLKPQPERSELNQDVNNVSSQHSFDLEALTKKYAEERQKRLRHNGGLEQYRTIDGQFSHLLADPYATMQLERKPIIEQCEALVIGGGYGAQLVAVELLRNGIKDIRIVEKGGDFGGTWYWLVF